MPAERQATAGPITLPYSIRRRFFLPGEVEADGVVDVDACHAHRAAFVFADGPPLAEKCGIAFQLTNILRDIREDAERGRIYLPAEDLRRFGVSAEDLAAGRRSDALVNLLRFEGERARAYYNQSMPLLDLIHRRSRRSLWALIEIYSRLLERIEQSDYDVFTRRVRLSALEKTGIVLRAMMS